METEDDRFNKAIQHTSILYSLSEGSTRSAACRAVAMGRRAFYALLETDEIFNAKVAAAEARAVDHMEGLAFTRADKAGEDPRYLRALFFWLKCRAGWVEARPMPMHAVARSGDGYPVPLQASEGVWHTQPHEQPGPSPRVPPIAVAAPRNEPAPAHLAAAVDPYEALRAADAEAEAQAEEDARAETARAEPACLDVPDERVPFVPSGDGAAEACPRLEPAPAPTQPEEKPGDRVPSVPSENTEPGTRNTEQPSHVPSGDGAPTRTSSLVIHHSP